MLITRHLFLVLVLMLGAGCTQLPADPAADPSPGGKADTAELEEGSAEVRGILALANQASPSLLRQEVGLTSLAVKNLVAHRDGPDGVAGTADDDPFDTVLELRAVPQVGPVAIARLLAHARAHGFLPPRLTIATFNIRWYGLDGDYASAPGAESRNPELRAFLAAHLADAEVLVFQEIVDVDLLRAELAPVGWTCVSYAGYPAKHQYVVLCHAPRFRLDLEPDDTDHTYEPVALGNLRPAVHGRLFDLESGRHLLHLQAVHLKAKPDSTAKRLEQARVLAERLVALGQQPEPLPVAIIGDFNTHFAKDTGLAADDVALIDEIFAAQTAVPLRQVTHGQGFTFRNQENVGFLLDRFWLSPAVGVSAVGVPGPCNLEWESGEAQILEHFDRVSDHCPLRATLAF